MAGFGISGRFPRNGICLPVHTGGFSGLIHTLDGTTCLFIQVDGLGIARSLTRKASCLLVDASGFGVFIHALDSPPRLFVHIDGPVISRCFFCEASRGTIDAGGFSIFLRAFDGVTCLLVDARAFGIFLRLFLTPFKFLGLSHGDVAGAQLCILLKELIMFEAGNSCSIGRSRDFQIAASGKRVVKIAAADQAEAVNLLTRIDSRFTK